MTTATATATDTTTPGTFAGLPANVQNAFKSEYFLVGGDILVDVVPTQLRWEGCVSCGAQGIPSYYCDYCAGAVHVTVGDVWEAAETEAISVCQRQALFAELEEVLLRRATSRYTETGSREEARVGHLHVRVARARAAVALCLEHGVDPGVVWLEEKRALAALAYA